MKDIYVKFEGASELQGDSTDTKHANEIEATTFSHSVFQPKSSSASSAGGHTAERTEHGEVLFTKDIDKATSKLFRACSAGTVYPKVLITFYRAYGGKSATATSQTRVDYYKIVLEDVVISSVTTNIGSGELPSETFGLKYRKISWEYKQHKMDGSSTSTGVASWDNGKNIAG
ncbi:type VI secretion system tube protein Hcp [Aquincola sp. S2]|uniref:Type VI secretion system tube protein Hcp n=1 Tax=Pseudaquabacterium terrae TaxID=2732868 RepID=A0ABX2EL81_9BURK|nr:type VI secretion system tube protein Hcp [Aquabacterium terrae]NRF69435.1 type VI secretion system tube protein Hcp [Aquabacterium terrae]